MPKVAFYHHSNDNRSGVGCHVVPKYKPETFRYHVVGKFRTNQNRQFAEW